MNLNFSVARVDSIMARPFRRLLSLPQKSTHSASVLIECGFLSCEVLFRLCALRFGFRLLCSDSKDPCKPLLFEGEGAIAVRVRQAGRWAAVDYSSAKAMQHARRRVEQQQLLSWQADDAGSWQLKGLKLRTGHSPYLLHDGRRLSAIRARLRLNRCSLNASLAERRVTEDPNCAACGVPETVEHCLLDCPIYAGPRRQCEAALDRGGLRLSYAVLLGADDSCPDDKLPTVLRVTGDFLLAIDNLRQL
jgi:hypothetical protein